MSEELIRLSKIMSERGLCSRREADGFIELGQVRVNGEVVSTLGTKVAPDARIELLGHAKSVQSNKVTILVNKPVGFVSTQPEKGYKPAIDLITEDNQDGSKGLRPFSQKHLLKLGVVGRLDIDSKGLLIFTQDGVLAKKIIGQHTSIEKEYLVRVEGQITDQVLKRLCFGLSLDGKPLKPAKVSEIQPNLLKFILKEGKKRQIRRMCELVGLNVTSLKRVRVGNVRLGDLPVGKWRYLLPSEKF